MYVAKFIHTPSSYLTPDGLGHTPVKIRAGRFHNKAELIYLLSLNKDMSERSTDLVKNYSLIEVPE